ncbi:MAG: GNAT family N-acetyltransferase [Clostridia bacterium]|nr:GNAT family N-acetyltransferase [Clostridia bacterium]
MEVAIRKWELGDAADMAAMLNNRKILDNIRDGLPYPYSEDDAKAYINTLLAAETNDAFAFAVVADKRVVGGVSAFRRKNVYRLSAELGYYIAEEYWNKGVCTEAVRQLAAHILESSDIIRIFAEAYEDNIASCRVLEKAGFSFEGLMRKAAIKNGVVKDIKLYALLRE